MVSRKPVPQSGDVGSAPYPVSPVTTSSASNFPEQILESTIPQPQVSGAEDTNAWTNEGVRGHGNAMADVPEALRVGPPGGVKQRPTHDVMQSTALNTNPFLPKTSNEKASEVKESSAAAWNNSGDHLEQPLRQPPLPPVTITQGMFYETLTALFSNLSQLLLL